MQEAQFQKMAHKFILTFCSLMSKRWRKNSKTVRKSSRDPLHGDSFPGSLGLPRWRPCQIPDPGAVLKCQNPVPGESCLSQNPVGSPSPPPWGLTLTGALLFSFKAMPLQGYSAGFNSLVPIYTHGWREVL